MSSPLAQRVVVRLDPERIDRQLAGARSRVVHHVRVRRATRALAAIAVLAAAIVLFVRGFQPAPGALEGTAVESVGGGETVTMPDGSRIVLEPGSRATLTSARPDLVRWTIERGGAELDVSHVPGRKFVVAANGWEASVLGTRFVVRAASATHGVEVHVKRGRVAVGRVGEVPTRVLEAGETWSERTAAIPDAFDATAPVESARSAESRASYEAAEAPPERSAAPPAPTGAPRPAPERAGPSDLLARAEAARAANRPREAAAAFEALRSHYPRDPRAGLAAFELGRLRLDALGDPRGAAAAFADAIRLAPNAPYREDAEARLVEAYDAAGERARCEEAKATFLERHRSSVHRAIVGARCRRQ
ncbi:MAG: FecR domain-containing protein [Labilithrix sp.]|nr:FecR domain-containing protein [Labilithrix sp.]